VTAETIQAEVDAKTCDNEAVLGWIRTEESALHQMKVAGCPPKHLGAHRQLRRLRFRGGDRQAPAGRLRLGRGLVAPRAGDNPVDQQPVYYVRTDRPVFGCALTRKWVLSRARGSASGAGSCARR
jgi:hypothetical protein